MDCTTCQNYKPIEPKPFDWESFKAEKIAVHCDTEEKAKAFLKQCDEHKIIWCSGGKASGHSNWDTHKESTSYNFDSGLEYCDDGFYKNSGYTIIESPFAQEKPSEFYNCKVVCVKWNGCLYTPGKVYTVKNGHMEDNFGGNSSNLVEKIGNDIKYTAGQFIPFLGEQS